MKNDEHDLRIDEPTWVFRYVHGGRILPFRGVADAERVYKECSRNQPVARMLAARVWDEASIRLLRKATTYREIKSIRNNSRSNSKAWEAAERKLAKLCNEEALVADGLTATLKALENAGRNSVTKKVQVKIRRLFSEHKKSATTIADFQRIFYCAAHWSEELHLWAAERWDELSKKEVDAVTTLAEAEAAHSRSYSIEVDGVCSTFGTRSSCTSAAARYAAAKWDALALTSVENAVSKEDLFALLPKVRDDSDARHVVFEKLLALETTFDGVRYIFRLVHKEWEHKTMKTVIRNMINFCSTAGEAAWLYQNVQLSAEDGMQLIRRFHLYLSKYPN